MSKNSTNWLSVVLAEVVFSNVSNFNRRCHIVVPAQYPHALSETFKYSNGEVPVDWAFSQKSPVLPVPLTTGEKLQKCWNRSIFQSLLESLIYGTFIWEVGFVGLWPIRGSTSCGSYFEKWGCENLALVLDWGFFDMRASIRGQHFVVVWVLRWRLGRLV